jgi:hypothetical protein
LAANTTGSVNTATGDVALSINTTGSADAASGANLAAILALEPVPFHYKDELDGQDVPQFGPVAEAVENLNPRPGGGR